MNIPLDHFEQYIDENILQRGLSYFRDGCVIQLDEITEGEFEAVVEGTIEYTVRLKIENNNLTEYFCTCPYEYGPFCKHVAAVLYYLKQEETYILTSKKSIVKGQKESEIKGPKKPKEKRKTVKEQVGDLLEKLSHDDLKQFITEQSLANPSFRSMFISGFTHKFKGESKAVYSQQIKSILRAVKGRSEYIDLSGVRMMSNEVYKKHNVSRNKYREACRYIRRMKKLGAGRRVQNLVDNLKKQYPQRRALLDELDSI